jgi:hypothetical protein
MFLLIARSFAVELKLGSVLPDGGKEVMPLSVGYPNDGGER